MRVIAINRIGSDLVPQYNSPGVMAKTNANGHHHSGDNERSQDTGDSLVLIVADSSHCQQ